MPYRLEKFYPKDFNPAEYWDTRYAGEHIKKDFDEFRQQEFWPLLQKELKKDGHYLDAGAGIGGWVLFLDAEGYDVEGIDVAARTVRAMTEFNRDLKVKIASITQIPYVDASFDGVLAIGVLEYVENKLPEALAEIHRVLKPGGMFFIEVPTANVLRRWLYLPLKRLEKLFKEASGQTPTFANYLFDPRELSQMLTQAGFITTTLRPHELPDVDAHYGLYIDWPFLRGSEPYKLNALGKFVKLIANTISPWVAATGAVVVARKQEA